MDTIRLASDGILKAFRNNSLPFKSLMNEITKECVLKLLAESSGSRAETARKLGMNRTTLVERLRKYGIHSPVNPSS